MRLPRVVLLPILVALALATGASPRGGASSPELSAALGRALLEPGVAPGRTAALAVDVSTGALVFQQNAELALTPASAEKLAVSLAALHVLGPGYRFRTEVLGRGTRSGRTWRGNLFLVGYGDPTLAVADLDVLAGDLAAQGIRRVAGRVLGDEGHFDARRDAPGWRPSFVGIESRPLSALAVAESRFTGIDGSAAAAARAFTAALVRRGIQIEGAPGKGRAPAGALPLALDTSERLSAIVRRMNTDSDNFVAEMVLKELGATSGAPGSTAAGARVVRRTLARVGVPLQGVRIADGSGLSSFDRLTVSSLVAILQAGSEDSGVGAVFVGSLAVAGVSGTLERRLDRRPTRRRVRAKTGTTLRASALAGFVGRRFAFAILQNGSPVPYWSARAAQDRFVTILARQSG